MKVGIDLNTTSYDRLIQNLCEILVINMMKFNFDINFGWHEIDGWNR